MKKTVGIHAENCEGLTIEDNVIVADTAINLLNSKSISIARNKIYSPHELALMDYIKKYFIFHAEALKEALGAERYQECKIKSLSIPERDGQSTRQNVIDIIAVCSGVATVWPFIEGPLNQLLEMLSRFI